MSDGNNVEQDQALNWPAPVDDQITARENRHRRRAEVFEANFNATVENERNNAHGGRRGRARGRRSRLSVNQLELGGNIIDSENEEQAAGGGPELPEINHSPGNAPIQVQNDFLLNEMIRQFELMRREMDNRDNRNQRMIAQMLNDLVQYGRAQRNVEELRDELGDERLRNNIQGNRHDPNNNRRTLRLIRETSRINCIRFDGNVVKNNPPKLL